ncbi:hypothetical protein LXL04_018230 [Taraxacum kok-saghyz]
MLKQVTIGRMGAVKGTLLVPFTAYHDFRRLHREIRFFDGLQFIRIEMKLRPKEENGMKRKRNGTKGHVEEKGFNAPISILSNCFSSIVLANIDVYFFQRQAQKCIENEHMDWYLAFVAIVDEEPVYRHEILTADWKATTEKRFIEHGHKYSNINRPVEESSETQYTKLQDKVKAYVLPLEEELPTHNSQEHIHKILIPQSVNHSSLIYLTYPRLNTNKSLHVCKETKTGNFHICKNNWIYAN